MAKGQLDKALSAANRFAWCECCWPSDKDMKRSKARARRRLGKVMAEAGVDQWHPYECGRCLEWECECD